MTDVEADCNGSIDSGAYDSINSPINSPYSPTTPSGRKVSMPIDKRSSRLVRDSIISFVALGGREISDEVLRLRLMVGSVSSITLNAADYQRRFVTKTKFISTCSRNLWTKLRRDNSNAELLLEYFLIVRDYYGILNQHACQNRTFEQSNKKKVQNNNITAVDLRENRLKSDSHIPSISAGIENDDIFDADCVDTSTHDSSSDANGDNIATIHARIDAFMDMIAALEERMLVASIRSKSSQNNNFMQIKSQRKARRAKRRRIVIASTVALTIIAMAIVTLLLLVYVFNVPIF